MSSESPNSKREFTDRIRGAKARNTSNVFDRERLALGERIAGYQRASAMIIGCGALGGMVALGLTRKGIAKLTLIDGDTVDVTNLNRQRFTFSDIDEYKAQALADNLKREVVAETTIEPINLYFEEARDERAIAKPTICICLPDDDQARYDACSYSAEIGAPLIVSGLSDDADSCYLFAQGEGTERGCWNCLNKGSLQRRRCGVGATINMPLVVAGIALTVCDAIVCGDKLPWNYRRLSLSGDVPDMMAVVPKWIECELCGNREASKV